MLYKSPMHTIVHIKFLEMNMEWKLLSRCTAGSEENLM